MEIRPRTISNFSYPQRFVRGLQIGGTGPLVLLECFVTGGRTLQAAKRGGFDEARERLTEESVGAFFWFCGVKAFNKMNDCIGKWILRLFTPNFDGKEDDIRKPVTNYLHDEKLIRAAARGELSEEEIAANFDEAMLKRLNKIKKRIGKIDDPDKAAEIIQKRVGKYLQELTPKHAAIFKSLKIGSSIILANALVGLVVPRINQKITRILQDKRQDKHTVQDEKAFKPVNMDTFISDAANDGKDKVSFTGISPATLLSVANHFENDTVYQLLSTDVGIAGGRAVSARNNHERTEVLFRDLTSIYFYMFNMPNINRWLNLLEDGRKTRLDPVGAKEVSDLMLDVLKENGNNMSVDDFSLKVLGNNNNVYKITPDLNAKFKNGVINLETFLEHISKEPTLTAEEIETYSDLAKRMSKLQPAIERKTRILTKTQVKDVFREGYLNMPEFLDSIYGVATGGKHKNPYKYVSQSDLDSMKDDMFHYVNEIIKKARKAGKNITPELIEKARRINFAKNAINWGIGFAISATFLSTLIPKIQYWITKVTTGQNAFPGTTDYSAEKKSK